MERKFLEDLGLEKDVIDKVLDEHSSDIGKHKKQIGAIETERDGLKEQLEKANKAIADMDGLDAEGLKRAAAEWEQKHKDDTESLKAEIAKNNYTHAAEALSLKETFTSEAARKAFVSDLIAKSLPLEDGKFTGYDDFKKTYIESDPGAFASNEKSKSKVDSGFEHNPNPDDATTDAFVNAARQGAGLNTKKEE